MGMMLEYAYEKVCVDQEGDELIDDCHSKCNVKVKEQPFPCGL